jgi:hypothetical protein
MVGAVTIKYQDGRRRLLLGAGAHAARIDTTGPIASVKNLPEVNDEVDDDIYSAFLVDNATAHVLSLEMDPNDFRTDVYTPERQITIVRDGQFHTTVRTVIRVAPDEATRKKIEELSKRKFK